MVRRLVDLDLNTEEDLTFRVSCMCKGLWQEETKNVQGMARRPVVWPHKREEGGCCQITAGPHGPANKVFSV